MLLAGVALAQSTSEAADRPEVHVPIQGIGATAATNSMTMNPTYGFPTASRSPADDSHYRKSALGKWQVPQEVDRSDPSIRISLQTPDGPMTVEFDVFIDGKPFREVRESLLDNILEQAKSLDGKESTEAADDAKTVETEAESNDEEEIDERPDGTGDATEEKPDDESSEAAPAGPVRMSPITSASANSRLVSYAHSRADRLTRYELRRRFADLTDGPSVVFANSDLAAERRDLLPLFALLDLDVDGNLSATEIEAAQDILNSGNYDADHLISHDEVVRALDGASPHRQVWTPDELWRAEVDDGSGATPDIRLSVSFGDKGGGKTQEPGLSLHESSRLDDAKTAVGTATIRYDVLATQEGTPEAIVIDRTRWKLVVSAAQPTVSSAASIDEGPVSIGIACDGYSLFRIIDTNGDWQLSQTERQKCAKAIASLDLNEDGQIAAGELPVVIHACITRGAHAHRVFKNKIAVVQATDRNSGTSQPAAVAPEWFASMDSDNDNVLATDEFLGDSKAFAEMDENKDGQLSVKEARRAAKGDKNLGGEK